MNVPDGIAAGVAPGVADSSLLALDVGSSRVKAGFFPASGECSQRNSLSAFPIASAALRDPDETFQVVHRGEPAERWTDQLAAWLATLPRERDAACVVAAVHPSAAATCIERLIALGWPQARVLVGESLPIRVLVKEPFRVGIDRLLGAVAANRLRKAGQPAICVDLGTAITIDLIDSEGSFAGGAILPGAALGASALHLGTASLPIVSIDDASSPWAGPCVGKSTVEAIASGLHWGTIGAVVELVRRMSDLVGGVEQLFVTGGDAPRVLTALTERLPHTIRHFPHLVLSGMYAFLSGAASPPSDSVPQSFP